MDLLIISQEDANQWGDFLVSRFQELDVTVEQRRLEAHDTRLLDTHVKLIIVSPDLFSFLTTHDSYTFRDVITHPQKALLFLCGTKLEDFSAYHVLDRFPYLKELYSFTHNEIDDLLKKTVEYVDNAQEEAKIEAVVAHEVLAVVPEEDDAPPVNPRKGSKPEKKLSLPTSANQGVPFELVPATVNSEENTEVVVSLNQPLSSDSKVILELYNQLDEWKKVELKHKRLNPYTYKFTAPNRMEGSKIVRLTVDDQVVGINTLLYQSNARTTSDLLQFYIHSIDLLCRLCRNSAGISLADVDKQLTMLFKATNEVPTIAYEKLFGLYEFALIESSSSRLPTMLHLAAHYGLEEFTSQLLDLPWVWDANDIRNNEGHYPYDLARLNDHSDLSDVLQSSRDIREMVQETYTVMSSDYYNTNNAPESQEQEIYTNPDYEPKPPDASKHSAFKGYLPMGPGLPPRSMSLPQLDQDPDEVYEVFDPKEPRPPRIEEDDLYLPMNIRPRPDPSQVHKPESKSRSVDEDYGGWGRQRSMDRADVSARSRSHDNHDDDYLPMNPTLTRPKPPDKIRDPFKMTMIQPEPHPATGGSRKQQELIDMMNDVKEGTLTQEQAEHLFSDWKQRMFDGTKQCSFKEKQARLNEMRKDVKQMQKSIQISTPIYDKTAAAYGERSHRPTETRNPAQFIHATVCTPPQPPARPVIQRDTPAPQSAVDEDGIYLDLLDTGSRSSSASNGSRASTQSTRSSHSSGFAEEGEFEDVIRSKSGDKTSRHRNPDNRKSFRMEVLEAQLATKPTVINLPIPNRSPSPLTLDMPMEEAPPRPKPGTRRPSPRNPSSGSKPKPPARPQRPK